MSRCPISGKFVARDNPGTPKVTKPDGEEVVFCCPSHKTQYLRENPVKFNRYMQDAIIDILATDYAHRFISPMPAFSEMEPYYQRAHIKGAWSHFLRQMTDDPFPSNEQRRDALTKFMTENFNLRKRDVKTILRRGVRTEGSRQMEEAREFAPEKMRFAVEDVEYTILDEDRRAQQWANQRARGRAAIAEEKKEERFTPEILSLVGRADPLGMVTGTEGLYIHSFNTMPQPTTASQFRDFMNIRGEVCFSTLEEDKSLYIPRRQDAFLAVVVKGTPRLHAPGDVWSERDYRGQRYPTRPAEEWHSHDEAFVTPKNSDLRAILVSPNHWHLARIRKAAEELGVVLIIMRSPPYMNLDAMMAEEEEWRESERELWGRIYDDLYSRRRKGYKSIDLNVYGEMDVERELPVRKRKYKSRPRQSKPKFRKNPYEYLIPEGLTPKTAGRAKHAIIPGTRRRLKKAGDIILPEGVVRFVFPKPDGRFIQEDIKPEEGVFKVLVDIVNTNVDNLTPLGLWHRTFQGLIELAYVHPPKRGRASPMPGIAVGVPDPGIKEIMGYNAFIAPRTRWWRKGRNYVGGEDWFDSLAMAMAFPGGIVYGVRPVGHRKGPQPEHPPDVKAALRAHLRPIEKRDTERVRRWAGEQARRGVVTLTSGDMLFSNNDQVTYAAEEYLETGVVDPKYQRHLSGISSILEEDYEGHFRPYFGLDPLPRKNPGAVDPQGRYIPEKYLAGLPPELRAARIRELGESRSEYGTGDFSELPTDRAARKMGLVKLSAYRMVAQQRGFDISQVSDMKDMATKALRYYGVQPTAAVVNKLAAGLDKVYDKGLAAWKSGGHRPGATGRNWADARVASVLVGGKAAWTADKKQFAMLPPKALRAVIDQLPEVYQALSAQGRQRDINYIQKASGMTTHDNPAVGGSEPTLGELVLYIHKVIGVGNDEIDAKVSTAYYRDAHRFVDPIHPSSPSSADAYLQHLADTTSLTNEDIAAITRDALDWWRNAVAYGVRRKRQWLGDVRRHAEDAEQEDHFFRSDMDEFFTDPKYRQTVGRQLEAARKLRYKAMPGWNFGEPTQWRCVAPENHLCGSAKIDGTLYVKHPDHWADMSAYPTPHPGEEFNRWIYLAEKHKNRAFPTYFLSGRREAVEEWLRNRTPSRKALEGKLKQFVAKLPVAHDFRNYPVPEWVSHFGGRHIANDAELQVVGRRNGWCFGSTHYASHLQELIDEHSYLYLIPHPDGLIALKLLREGGRKGLSFPNDLDQTFGFYEAKFPNNEEATPAVKMLWRQWMADQQDTVPARVRGSKSRTTRRDMRKRGKRSKRERYDPTFRKRGGRRNPHEEM